MGDFINHICFNHSETSIECNIRKRHTKLPPFFHENAALNHFRNTCNIRLRLNKFWYNICLAIYLYTGVAYADLYGI